MFRRGFRWVASEFGVSERVNEAQVLLEWIFRRMENILLDVDDWLAVRFGMFRSGCSWLGKMRDILQRSL